MGSYDVPQHQIAFLSVSDGITECKRLRGDKRTAVIPILVMTPIQIREEYLKKLKATNSLADDYITQPFDLEGLELSIKALLRRTKS